MDKNIYCIVIDDAPLARELLEKHIAKLKFLKLVAVYDSAIEAIETINSQQVDLLFLDIEMPEMDGISLIRTLEDPPEVIFTTAYEDYAVESYEISATDYLLKPIGFERFVRAVNKVLKRRSMYYKAHPQNPEKGDLVQLKREDIIIIRENKSQIRLHHNEIFYIESIDDYLKIHLDEEYQRSHMTLKKMMDQLPGDSFIQIHRSYIVSKQVIRKLDGNRVILKNGIKLPVGLTYRQKVNDFMENR